MKHLAMVGMLMLSSLFIACNDDNTDTPAPLSITSVAEMDQALQALASETSAPGFALSIVRGDAIVYQNAFGFADIASNKAYRNQTTQPIASISKTFIAAAIVKAIEQGHLTLETEINQVLPFEIVNPKQPNAPIKVKHLVSHSSGLIDRGDIYNGHYHIVPGEDTSTPGAALIQQIMGITQRSTQPLGEFLQAYYAVGGAEYSEANFANYAPGSQWSYSNIASSLAAYVVEVAVGQPFSEYVKSQILQPLGMNQSSYYRADLDASDIATMYFDPQTPLPYYFNDSYPDGSLLTSNEDLTKYLMEMMRGARGEASQLFSAQGYETLFGELLAEGLVPPSLGLNHGVFWVLRDGEIQHDGGDPGVSTNLVFDETGQIGYLLLTNMDASTSGNEAKYFEVANRINQAVVSFLEHN